MAASQSCLWLRWRLWQWLVLPRLASSLRFSSAAQWWRLPRRPTKTFLSGQLQVPLTEEGEVGSFSGGFPFRSKRPRCPNPGSGQSPAFKEKFNCRGFPTLSNCSSFARADGGHSREGRETHGFWRPHPASLSLPPSAANTQAHTCRKCGLPSLGASRWVEHSSCQRGDDTCNSRDSGSYGGRVASLRSAWAPW